MGEQQFEEQDATPPTVQAAVDRKAALTREAGTADVDAAVRHARAQAPRGRTERPTSTAG